jgi:hypothetical protein
LKKYHWAIGIFFFVTFLIRLNSPGVYTDYSPLFFIWDFCFGMCFAYNNYKLPLLISLGFLFINPFMVLPTALFSILYFSSSIYFSSRILDFLSTNTLFLFLFHESFMKVLLGKWGVYGLNKFFSFCILLLLSTICFFVYKRFENYLKNTFFN